MVAGKRWPRAKNRPGACRAQERSCTRFELRPSVTHGVVPPLGTVDYLCQLPFQLQYVLVATELYSVPMSPAGNALEDLPDASIVAARDGSLLHAPEGSEDAATAFAAALRELDAAGHALGFSGLYTVTIRGAASSTVIPVRERGFLVAQAGHRPVSALEKALERWSIPEPGGPMRDGWAALRNALVRGRLPDAIACWREIAAAPALHEALAGSEPLRREELGDAVEGLLHGIACALAHDGAGGLHWLRDLAAPSQGNLSIRWLAHLWSCRAALECGDLSAAGPHAREALAIAAHLDSKARAVSSWAAAEAFALGRDPREARARLTESHDAFSRAGDAWGVSRTRLAEARILAALGAEADAEVAAGLASAADPAWDGPHLFLARRFLLRGDAVKAQQILAPLQSPAAGRERALLVAFEHGLISAADLVEFLHARDAPPSPETASALKRIAAAAPRCNAARDAVGWVLLRLGRYDEAKTAFAASLAQQHGANERLSLLAGLGRIAAASRRGAGKPRRKAQAAEVEAPPPAGRNIVLRGELSEVPLPEVLEFLRAGRRGGTLVCRSGQGSASLRFSGGFITGATLENARVLLGTEEKIELVLRRMLRWETGQFSFERDDQPAVPATGVELDPQALLLKLYAESDEASRDG